MRLITKTADLEQFCQELASQPFVAVDTEFMRETTYWPKLCLIQAAAPGVEAVIDPLAEGSTSSPFLDAAWPIEKVLKVFHAARQDLEIFLKLAGQLPHPVFDTQIAAMACGYGDTVAYDALVQQVLKRRLDKSSRFTDWSRRPLSENQLTYALADVTHLRDIYPRMHEKLESANRLTGSMKSTPTCSIPDLRHDAGECLEAPEAAQDDRRLRARSASRRRLARTPSAAARRAARARRERRSALRNRRAASEERRDFDRMRAVPRGFGNSRAAQELIQALDRAFSDPDRPVYKHDRRRHCRQVLGRPLNCSKCCCATRRSANGVAPRLIASRRTSKRSPPTTTPMCQRLRGWRREVFGERALALKHGKLALKLQRRQSLRRAARRHARCAKRLRLIQTASRAQRAPHQIPDERRIRPTQPRPRA
jgi:ribonuclease D